MEVIRVIKNKNYTTISNQLFKNKGISLKAKGLMGYLLSLPNDWNLSINGIVACSKEGRRAIGNIINELIAAGYIERNQVRKNGKFIGYDYFVFEQPQAAKPTSVKPKKDNSLQISKEVTKERINKNNYNNMLEFRKMKFGTEVSEISAEIGMSVEEANNFLSYWTEPNKSKTYMRWELEKTWDLNLRLKRWQNNNKNWNKGFNAKERKKYSKIDMHLQSQKEAEELLTKKYSKTK